ncbi:uncharacterized protein LOC114533625 isoform X2 [Dendronephthya gigantea]|uniref:uncharacterized protein LOC114533625 isoform X2 n=1 Tax=Dendronephthya gigantea TaxID=151771 RepID=UPI00106A95C9|nr:uncharacterized protein LOC114533625 isoform X2 [Dendronephthya gigantea]
MAHGFTQLIRQADKYALYVLTCLLAAYLLNQLDRYALVVTSRPMAQDIHFGDKGCVSSKDINFSGQTKLCNKEPGSDKVEKNKTRCLAKYGNGKYNTTLACRWDYDGTGEQYQILAGPVFILVYTITGIPLGFLGGSNKRSKLLASCLLLWTTMTLLTGFATKYWQLVITRFILGMGEAGCTPFASSLIADYFDETLRASAMGVYNWGIYIGYSLSYALGNFIVDANIDGKSWRWVFWIAAIPGFIVAPMIFFSVKEPVGKVKKERPSINMAVSSKQRRMSSIVKVFLGPSTLILCLAGAIRNAGGYVWAYNTQPYFDKYYPEVNLGYWMSWIPLVSGSMGVLLGGVISDCVIKNRGLYARLFGAPFAAGALFLHPPYCFLSLIAANIIGEMWIGVALTVIVELAPKALRTPVVAYYGFIIDIIGGNVPLAVPPLKEATGSLRIALYLLYPGLYLTSSIIFLLTLFVLKWDKEKVKNLEDKMNEQSSPLLDDENDCVDTSVKEA